MCAAGGLDMSASLDSSVGSAAGGSSSSTLPSQPTQCDPESVLGSRNPSTLGRNQSVRVVKPLNVVDAAADGQPAGGGSGGVDSDRSSVPIQIPPGTSPRKKLLRRVRAPRTPRHSAPFPKQCRVFRMLRRIQVPCGCAQVASERVLPSAVSSGSTSSKGSGLTGNSAPWLLQSRESCGDSRSCREGRPRTKTRPSIRKPACCRLA